jgi:C1A family cysteine protease
MGQNISFFKNDDIKHLFTNDKSISQWVDLRSNASCPKVLNSENLNSSASNALSNLIRFWLRKKNKKEYQPSRLYMYYFARSLENNINNDTDVSLKNLCRAVEKFGICSEKNWPYDIAKFNIKPDDNIVKETTINFKYYHVKNKIHELKRLLSHGYPIIFMMPFFDNNSSEIILLLKKNKKPLEVKAITIYGYRDSSNMFICMNSLGTNWGEKGFFYVPYKYVSKHGYDFWTITF